VDGIISLLIEDTTFAVPPLPFWLCGRATIRGFISTGILDGKAHGRWRLLPVRANGEVGFAWYRKNDGRPGYQAYAI
jgi:RNA polymerase sigma-70 factor (ECF subfamily)